MAQKPAPVVTRETILRLLGVAANNMETADWIARFLERKHKRKAGSLHLAVKRLMRRMESAGDIIVLPPKDQWDSYMLCLADRR